MKESALPSLERLSNVLFIYIYLLDMYPFPPPRSRRATKARKATRRKERRKYGSEQRAKPSSPTQAIDARMGDIFIYYTRIYSCHCGVGARQRRGKRSEKGEGKESYRVRESETAYPNDGNWRAHRGGRIERKQKKNKTETEWVPAQVSWTIQSSLTTLSNLKGLHLQ